MALFRKKKTSNRAEQPPAQQRGRAIPRRQQSKGSQDTRRASAQTNARQRNANPTRGNSQGSGRMPFQGVSQRGTQGNGKMPPQGSRSQSASQATPQQGRRKSSAQRTARAGSQQRTPLERITPSRGHKPSQRNTSVRRSSQSEPQQSSRMNTSALRKQKKLQQDMRQGFQPQQMLRESQQYAPQQGQFDDSEYVSYSVDELRRADHRNQRTKRPGEPTKARRKVRRYIVAAVIALVVVVGGVVGGIAVYNSSMFSIQNVKVTGVEHLTASEMTQLANVPADTTLLRVDTATIAERIKKSAWVEDVTIKRIFPDTLELVVTEREMAAIAEIPVKSISGIKQWAIAKDTMWLMPIPDIDSEAAKTTSPKIYEDAENVIHIKDLPFGTVAEIGKLCTDATVNNVMAILSGMTTELADMVVEVSASGIAETTLILNNGVEVAFGEAKDIRDKERVVLEILSRNPDGVSYINVRMVETPTWRAI